MKIRCVIADDEYLAIQVLEQYATAIPSLMVLKTFTDPREAIKYLADHETDLLILDIQMPYFSGFEMIRALKVRPALIFVTARHDLAVQAYDMDVLDYLVKPVSAGRFQKAIAKAAEYIRYKKAKTEPVGTIRDFLMIRSGYRVIKLLFSEIKYIEGLNEYIKIHTPEKMHTTLAALRDIENELPTGGFVRIHKSYIVSTVFIKEFNSKSVRLGNGKELPIGRTYKAAFLEKMKQ